ncbi:MAG: SdpI family protein [Candidatus Heteroscillospira sp.]
MKSTTKNMILTTAVALLPIILGLSIYDRLPAQVPTHWNFSGEIDSYSSRAFAVFGMPVFLAAMSLFVQFMLEHDPKKSNMPGVMKAISRWLCPLLSIVIVPITLFTALGYNIPVALVICLAVGLIFIIIGNYLPKCRQSYTMGIRLPWTLSSEENWNRTHRMAGKLWVLGGFLFILEGFYTQAINSTLGTALTFVLIFVTVAIPAVYSFMLYKKGI